MAPVNHQEMDIHPGGLAEKVRYESGGTRYTGGMAWVMPVCDECGALHADELLHDNWHDEQDRIARHSGKPFLSIQRVPSCTLPGQQVCLWSGGNDPHTCELVDIEAWESDA
jgi:hypothetical protein